jgi:hypothetical protein
MIVVIPKHKVDRSGGKLPTKKPVFANPIYPEICPLLILGIILLSRENNENIEAIFKGKKSEENMNNWLKKTLDPTNNELITRSHLTSHCTRKGKLSMNCILYCFILCID